MICLTFVFDKKFDFYTIIDFGQNDDFCLIFVFDQNVE